MGQDRDTIRPGSDGSEHRLAVYGSLAPAGPNPMTNSTIWKDGGYTERSGANSLSTVTSGLVTASTFRWLKNQTNTIMRRM